MESPNRSFTVRSLRLYLGFSAVASPLYHLIRLYRLRQGKECALRWRERFGQTELDRPTGRLVWFHSASIGESHALLRLIHKILAEADDIHVLLTTQSLTSANLLAGRLPARVLHQFAPYDARGPVNRFLSHWNPDLAIWAESELWPRMLFDTARRGTPMLLVNARVSQRTAARWRRWPHVVRNMLAVFDKVLVQDETLVAFLREIGFPTHRLEVVGSLKAELLPLQVDEAAFNDMAAQISGRRRWLAASTHEGEEIIVASAHEKAFGRGSATPILIVAPRHPHRGPQIARMLHAQGWRTALRSLGQKPSAETEIYIADTLGEMGLWYRLCPVAFLGGSLVPAGGHNPYEPARLGCVVIHGSDTSNFIDIYDRLDRCGGALEAPDTEALVRILVQLQDTEIHTRAKDAAFEALRTSSGATSATMNTIRHTLPNQLRS